MPLIHESTKKYEEIPSRLNKIGKEIVDSAYTVHKELGAGLLERVYEVCLAHELTKRGLSVERQVPVSIRYYNIEFDEGFRIDLLVENEVVCELKAVDQMNPVWKAQILSHLKLMNKRLGYLINFNVINIGKGTKRIVN
jgi:GxxExxY protein